ncbi:hypothetical protein [Streptomyces deccanensis]|uniref:hypothetical protein n=1 Tax=Streptomyces deccanensis TaxID=424188 RepID=UPI001EFA801C|nr:hypothetical protein [Streptomyces deccanensis]ULR50803.1 hypothetical protein L3078_16660 [Streptomyces deccanensis]
MRHPTAAALIAVLVSLAACVPTEGGATSTPYPHTVVGIDVDSLSEAEVFYLDDVLEKAPDTKAGRKWRASAISADRGGLDMLIDGDRLDFCKGTSPRDKESFVAQMGQDEGAFAFLRQEAARKRLC